MKIEKIDPQLHDTLKRPEDLLVSIRLVKDAQAADLEDLGRLVDGAIEPGLPVVSGRVSSERLSELSDNPAVMRVRLSRRLTPARH